MISCKHLNPCHLAVGIISAIMMLSACTSSDNQSSDNQLGEQIADGITYMVFIRPENPNDEFENECLKTLQDTLLIDKIFKSVYANGIKAYDYFNQNELSIEDIKVREVEDPAYSRDKISVIQFTEQWFYNETKPSFTKKVTKIHIGYGVRNEDGIIVANHPGMVIYMK